MILESLGPFQTQRSAVAFAVAPLAGERHGRRATVTLVVAFRKGNEENRRGDKSEQDRRFHRTSNVMPFHGCQIGDRKPCKCLSVSDILIRGLGRRTVRALSMCSSWKPWEELLPSPSRKRFWL